MMDLDDEEYMATRKLNGLNDGIEVGEYVRTKEGFIYRIENGEEFYADSVDLGIGILPDVDGIWIDREYSDYIDKRDIFKHSKQLIDLIEVGDFVNGYRVLAIEDSSKRILIYKNEREKYERWIYIQEYNGRIHTQDDIVEILTKESYMANCYKVGGEE